jgi:hypothetical protein
MPAATSWSDETCRNGSSNAVCRLLASVDLPELEAPFRKMIRPWSARRRDRFHAPRMTYERDVGTQ